MLAWIGRDGWRAAPRQDGVGSIGWLGGCVRRNGRQRKPNPSLANSRQKFRRGREGRHGGIAGLGSSSIRIAVSDRCCQFTGIGVIMASPSTRPLARRQPQHPQGGTFRRSSRAVTSNTPSNRANPGADLHWGLLRPSHKIHQSTRTE